MLPPSCQQTTDACSARGAIQNSGLPPARVTVHQQGCDCKTLSGTRGNCSPAGQLSTCWNLRNQWVRHPRSRKPRNRLQRNRHYVSMLLINRFQPPSSPARRLHPTPKMVKAVSLDHIDDDGRRLRVPYWRQSRMSNSHCPRQHMNISFGWRFSNRHSGAETGRRPSGSCAHTAVSQS